MLSKLILAKQMYTEDSYRDSWEQNTGQFKYNLVKLIIIVESCNDDEADTIEDAMLSYHQGLVQIPGGSDNIVTGPLSHERQQITSIRFWR